MDGLLLVDKEPGFTSHDVVQKARRLLGQRKIGHCGTLDPAATGLLVLTLGSATRLTRFLISAPKVYSGSIQFGRATDTYDAEGKTVSEGSYDPLRQEDVEKEMEGHVGTSDQAAPPFSAKKVGGVKYYELARRGEEVPEARKEITIYEFRTTGALEDGRLPFLLSCTSGTYVRSLAHELGQALGCGAHLAALRRTRVGGFDIENALGLDVIENRRTTDRALDPAWVEFDSIPMPFAEVTVDAQQQRRLGHGQTILLRLPSGAEGDWLKLVSRRRKFVAVGSVTESIGTGGMSVVQPKIVFG